MIIGIDNALGIASRALSLRAERTQLLADNIANADTPGYKARDIDFKDLLARETGSRREVSVMATNERHIAGRNQGLSESVKYRVPLMPSLDGNTVDTQMEQSAFAENSIQFLTNFRILNGRIQGMMTSIKGE